MTDTKIEVVETARPRAEIRRFMPADLTTHGHWIMKRLMQKFPEADEHWLAGWLRGLIYDNGHLFLYQPGAVALAQIVTMPGIKPLKVIQERFVWVENKNDKDQLANAADFYEDIITWARGLRVDRIFVCEDSDVPKPDIEERTGRIFNTTICHVRL